MILWCLQFLPTPSARRATANEEAYEAWKAISTHALREEGDKFAHVLLTDASDFYPRPPRGGRRALGAQPFGSVLISTHALREEGDTM